MKIEIAQGNIADQDTEAIVNAANNYLWMGSGVAGAIKRQGGAVIEEEAMRLGPIEVGQAVTTSAGTLRARYVIHAAGMGQDLTASLEVVKTVTIAALNEAERLKLKSISFPAIGTGVGGLGIAQCAQSMLQAVREFKAQSLSRVRFVLYDVAAREAFESALMKSGKTE